MSAPHQPYQAYPSNQPRKLTRSTTDKYVGGVCGGLARYLNMDSTLVRILTVILALVTGGAPVIVAYLIALFLMPEDTTVPPPPVAGPQPTPAGDDVWGAAGPPWNAQTPQTAPQTDPQPAPVQDPPADDGRAGR